MGGCEIDEVDWKGERVRSREEDVLGAWGFMFDA